MRTAISGTPTAKDRARVSTDGADQRIVETGTTLGRSRGGVTIVCEPDQPYAGLLAAELGGDVRVVASLPAAAEALADGQDRSVLVIGPGLELEPVLAFAAALPAGRPGVRLVLVRHEPSDRSIDRALSAGVREVVAADNVAVVADAVRRVARAPAAGPSGRIVTVFSAKGGAGRTTLATNLAAVLHDGGSKQVCLLDLDLAFGDVATTLALEPVRGLVDALDWAGGLDAERVSSLVTVFRPGLDCILAPAGPGDGARVPAVLVAELLAALPAVYDYVVVDTPAQLSSTVLTALDAAHHQMLLTTPERPSLKNLRLVLDMCDLLGYSREVRAIVVNRSDSRVGLSRFEVEDLIRSPIASHLPSRRDVPASINRGVPLAMTDPDHMFSLAVRRLVTEQITPAASATGIGEQSWSWWW
jgi:MinD-like ATPase involved in chromosome partitioning or flagellar assembly